MTDVFVLDATKLWVWEGLGRPKMCRARLSTENFLLLLHPDLGAARLSLDIDFAQSCQNPRAGLLIPSLGQDRVRCPQCRWGEMMKMP